MFFKNRGGIITGIIRACAVLFFILIIAIAAFLYFFRGGSGYASSPSGKAFSNKAKPAYVNENLKGSKKAGAPPPVLKAQQVSADELFRVFNENEYAFNNQYRGRYFKIIGYADRVTADENNIPHIELGGGLLQTVDITLAKSIEHLAANIRKGDEIHVIGVVESGAVSFFVQKRIFVKNAVFASVSGSGNVKQNKDDK